MEKKNPKTRYTVKTACQGARNEIYISLKTMRNSFKRWIRAKSLLSGISEKNYWIMKALLNISNCWGKTCLSIEADVLAQADFQMILFNGAFTEVVKYTSLYLTIFINFNCDFLLLCDEKFQSHARPSWELFSYYFL